VTRVHAHLLTVVRLYGRPDRAGGQGNAGEQYAARAASGDRTLLSSCLTHCVCELTDIRDEVDAQIDDVPGVVAFPGSPDKVEAMRARIAAGLSLFSDDDRPPDLETDHRAASDET
jgi:hypothetical protein